MKITIELDTSKDDHKNAGVIALLGGSTLLALLDDDTAAMREARNRTLAAQDEARELHAEKAPTKEDKEPESTEPTFRAYGESSEGRARRTKVEMAQDENIETLFAQAKELGAKGLPKTISTDLPADDIEAELTTMVEVLKDEEPEEEDGFEVDGDGPATEPMDLDEFRAILTKGVKELGGKDVGALMKPYKSATDVPVDERNEYAQKLQDALNG